MRRFIPVGLILVSLVVGSCGESDAGWTVSGTGLSAEVTLDALSGLPNPTWTLDPVELATMNDLWRALPPTDVSDYPDVLGYRGIVVDLDDGSRLTVARGVVVFDDGVAATARSDGDNAFEIWLLETGLDSTDDTVRLIRSILDGIPTG